MNDPHVVALHYEVTHRADLDYNNAPPLSHDFEEFQVRIEKAEALAVMKTHYATVEGARAVVDPILRAWELEAALSFSPGELEFRYLHPDIVDRAPTPGVVHVYSGVSTMYLSDKVTVHISRGTYPSAPNGIGINDTVEDMWHRYEMLTDEKTYLTDAANYCLTALEGERTKNHRPVASDKYGISMAVLRKIGELASKKGGREGRKATAKEPLSPKERTWLQSALKVMIRRAAEVAFDPNASNRKITMADPDLPPLE